MIYILTNIEVYSGIAQSQMYGFCSSGMAGETVKITATVPRGTREWLRDRYPDATSDSQRILMSIKDARDLEEIIRSNDTVIVGRD